MDIDNLVYGHAKAKKAIMALLNRAQERYYTKVVKGLPYNKKPLKCLLIGESGTGKTHLVNSFEKLYDFPILKLDATSLSPGKGTDQADSDSIRNLILTTARKYYKEMEDYFSVDGVLSQLVVYIDEFDKLGISFESSGNWNKFIQCSFLTLIEEFEGVSWIFSGAFSGIPRKETKRSIGFFESESIKDDEISDRDILNAGIIPEMLGRINLIVELDRFTKQDYINILNEHLLPNYPDLQIDIDSVVEKAYASGQGIRSLTRQLESLQLDSVTEYKPLF